jgi:FtsZ-binding cell division protein ZapB
MAFRVKTLEEKLSQEVESSERLKQTVGELQSSKKDLENRLEKALKIIEDLKSRNRFKFVSNLFL